MMQETGVRNFQPSAASDQLPPTLRFEDANVTPCSGTAEPAKHMAQQVKGLANRSGSCQARPPSLIPLFISTLHFTPCNSHNADVTDSKYMASELYSREKKKKKKKRAGVARK